MDIHWFSYFDGNGIDPKVFLTTAARAAVLPRRRAC